MASTCEVLFPKELDTAGPEPIPDFAECTGMDEYDSYETALANVDRHDAAIVRVVPLDAGVIDRADRPKIVAKHRAGLDTSEEDPPGEGHPLHDREDVLLTPHACGVTDEALVRMSQRAAANVRTASEGELPTSTANRAELTGGEA